MADKSAFHRLRVEYEPLPAHHESLFLNRLNDGIGGPGKDRSQWSNFFSDRYTDADAIGIIDGEVCLTAPPVAQHIAQAGRLHNVVDAALPSGDHWGVDEWVLNKSTPIDVMWPNRFPIWLWRDDIVAIRRYLVDRFDIGPDERGAFATRWDAAWRQIMMATPRPGREALRQGYSQFNLMLNLLLHERAGGYAFHAIPRSVEAEGWRVLPALRHSYPDAVFTERPLLTQGANDEPVQGIVPVMDAHCLGRYPELKWTVAAATQAVQRSSTWGGAGQCSIHWASAIVGDGCVTDYMHAARAAVERASPRERVAGLHACVSLLATNSSLPSRERTCVWLSSVESHAPRLRNGAIES
eukprot:1237327-Prymnesium_polylepis.1